MRNLPIRSAFLTRLLLAGLVTIALTTTGFGQSVTSQKIGDRSLEGGQGKPPAAPVLDPHVTLTSSPRVEITGNARRAASIEVAGPLGLTTVPVVDDAFTALVPLAADQINFLHFTAVSGGGAARSAPTPAQITHDGTPPQVFIDLPAQGEVLATTTATVVGRIGDALSGSLGLTVDVNGVAADVDLGLGNSGTFFAQNVPLNPGTRTTLTVTASDVLGNTAQEEIAVLQATPTGARMELFSGDGQTATIRSVLANPIRVRLRDEDGSFFENKLVTFEVTRSDGLLSPDGVGDWARVLQVHTNAQGRARAFWQLGTDAGCGNNRVLASSQSIAAPVTFFASATPGPAVQIVASTGDSQVAEASGPAPSPLRVRVTDGANGVAGVPVTFDVVRGSGRVAGASSTIVTTGATGHAEVDFVLGPEDGNHWVQASFPGNTGQVAHFSVYGLRRRANGPTEFEGVVQDSGGLPITDAVCTLIVAGVPVASTVSDIDGRFLLMPTADGPAHLVVDGTTATLVGGLGGEPVPPGTFPSHRYRTTIVPRAKNGLPSPVRLPRLRPANERVYSTRRNTTLEMEGIEGLKLIVQAGSMTIDGQPAPDGTIIAVNPVQADDVPVPPPDGAWIPAAWTLEPPGASFDPPVRIEYPNMEGAPPGSLTYLWSYDHANARFEVVGSGQVSADGSMVVSDPGAGLTYSGWNGQASADGATVPASPGTQPTSTAWHFIGNLWVIFRAGAVEGCAYECADPGELAGTIDANAEDVCFEAAPNPLMFTASAIDSGGLRLRTCPLGPAFDEPIPSAAPDYTWQILRGGSRVASGAGPFASVAPLEPGKYECTFDVAVDRDCPPVAIELESVARLYRGLTDPRVKWRGLQCGGYCAHGFDDFSDPNKLFVSIPAGATVDFLLRYEGDPDPDFEHVFLTSSDPTSITVPPAPNAVASGLAEVPLSAKARGVDAEVDVRVGCPSGAPCATIQAYSFQPLRSTVKILWLVEENDDQYAGNFVIGDRVGVDAPCVVTGDNFFMDSVPNQDANGHPVAPMDDWLDTMGTPKTADDVIRAGPNGRCDTYAMNDDRVTVIPGDVTEARIAEYLNTGFLDGQPEALSAVFAQAMIEWTVLPFEFLVLNYDLNNDRKLNEPCSGSSEEAKVIAASNPGGANKVVFMVDNASVTDAIGCWYLLAPEGFVFPDLHSKGQVELYNTIAHELGHGLGLDHTIDADNLMQGEEWIGGVTPNGTHLRHWQWTTLRQNL